MSPQEQIVARFAPTGTLRAAINLGNPILAGSDPATGAAHGVSVDLARELGRRLGVAVELLTVDTAGKSVEAVAQQRADIGFFAIDPLRGADIAFTAPYVLIEGCYLVAKARRCATTTRSTAPATSSSSGRAAPTTCISRAS
jgi:polar amino acid transport system substrate-binding protein